ncbi:hypothetical protein L0222_25510 [bacterium]|nr:hypothetical protein [bacterium]MCI0606934.1 hypothetical protein [bacterium]
MSLHAQKINILLAVVFLAIPFCLCADMVNVNCDNAESLQAAIDGLSSPTGPHTINVTGTCVENVTIDHIDRLTIQGSSGATIRSASAANDIVVSINRSQEISLRQLIIDGDNQADDFGVAGVFAFRSDVDIRGCTIINNPDIGVTADTESTAVIGGPSAGQEVVISNNGAGIVAANNSILRIRGRTTIEDSVEDAVIVQASNLAVNGRTPPDGNIYRNNGFGIGIISGGVAGINGSNLIENNGPIGLFVGRVPHVGINAVEGTAPGFTTIQGHTQFGIISVSSNIFFSSPLSSIKHKVQNNGSSPITNDAGISAFRPGCVVARNVEIVNNIGAGIVLDGGACTTISDAAITGNSTDGLRVLHNSNAEFGGFQIAGEPIPNNTTISGNSGQQIACDATATIYGDLTGLPDFKCNTTDPKPPKGATPAAAAEAELEKRIENRLHRKLF